MIFSALKLIDLIFTLYLWSLLAMIIASWLVIFKVINPYQPFVRMIISFLHRIHDPILDPIRRLQYRLIPNAGGLDLSPIVAILLVQFLIVPIARQLALIIFA